MFGLPEAFVYPRVHAPLCRCRGYRGDCWVNQSEEDEKTKTKIIIRARKKRLGDRERRLRGLQPKVGPAGPQSCVIAPRQMLQAKASNAYTANPTVITVDSAEWGSRMGKVVS